MSTSYEPGDKILKDGVELVASYEPSNKCASCEFEADGAKNCPTKPGHSSCSSIIWVTPLNHAIRRLTS